MKIKIVRNDDNYASVYVRKFGVWTHYYDSRHVDYQYLSWDAAKSAVKRMWDVKMLEIQYETD